MIINRIYSRLLKYISLKSKDNIRIGKGAQLKPGTTIAKDVYMTGKTIIKGKTFIDVGTRINGKIVIKGKGACTIGKYCAIGEDIKIITSNHDTNNINLQYSLQKKIGIKPTISPKKGVKMGHNVWIGDNVIILSGVEIGNGAVLAAGSVVTKDVAPYSIIGGVPAKFIKFRFNKEKIQKIEKSEWWDWSIDKMKRNKTFFEIGQ
jgi:virginiamycin A acetyltransferase